MAGWAEHGGPRSPLMPRARYRQNPLPLGPDAPPPATYGPEQPLPPGLQATSQGQLELGVAVLGPLFERTDRSEPES